MCFFSLTPILTLSLYSGPLQEAVELHLSAALLLPLLLSFSLFLSTDNSSQERHVTK